MNLLVQNIGTIGYVVGACGYLCLAMLLILDGLQRPLAKGLLVACTLTALWAGCMAAVGMEPTPSLAFLDLARLCVWLYLLSEMVKYGVSSLVRRLGPLFLLITALVTAMALLGITAVHFNDVQVFAVTIKIGLVAALAGLILIEQINRNSIEPALASMRHFLIAVAIGFGYDCFYFAHAQVFGTYVLEWWALRSIFLLITLPLLLVSLRKAAIFSVDIFISRHVVFYSGAMVAVGAYLIAMALGVTYLKKNHSGSLFSFDIVFLTLAGVLLVGLLSSATLRRRWRVFIAKHFYKNKYDYRVQWLNFITTLSNGARDNVYRTSVQAIAQVIESGGGVFYARDDVQRSFIPVAVWPRHMVDAASLSNVSFDSELVLFLERKAWVIDLQEYARDPNFYGNICLPEQLADVQRFRIISPILEIQHLSGFVVLQCPPEPFELTFEDRDLLKTVGSHVATYVAQRRADDQLLANRQFEAFNRLVAFAMHDLKNSVSQLQLVTGNARQHRHNPEFMDDVLVTVENVSQKVMSLIEQMSRRRDSGLMETHDCKQLVITAVERCAVRQPAPVMEIAAEELPVACNADELINAVEHLIRNAQDATPAIGRVVVALRSVANQVELTVSDNGAGMSQEFVRERLFNPFDSTKGSKGMGIGAYQVRQCVLRLGGELSVASVPGQGTRFVIRLPMSSVVQAEPLVANATYQRAKV